MRDFGKVYSTFWTSDSTRDLSDRARLLAVYLLSGPHSNMIGCFRLPDGYVQEDLRWDKETVSKGFEELLRNGFATRDERSKWVLITNFLKWNPIENPNQGKSAARLFEQIPNGIVIKTELASILELQPEKFPRDDLERFRNRSVTVSKPGAGAGEGEGTESGDGTGKPPPNPPRGGTSENDPKPKKKKTIIDDPAFDKFWHHYPKKEAKADAWAAWRSLAPTPEVQEKMIMDILRRVVDISWQKDGGQFVPLPATYIRGRRWEDEGTTLPKGQNAEQHRDSGLRFRGTNTPLEDGNTPGPGN